MHVQTVQEMHENERYSQMVVYWESCFSGTMFEHLGEYLEVYAQSAANTREVSYACYWDEEVGAYLGDLYSINWMESEWKIEWDVQIKIRVSDSGFSWFRDQWQ